MTNALFLDATRVHESIIAHEFGHAWVQYVDECEDYRTMESAKDPQRARLVSHVQSFVLDLKVNNLLARRGFDTSVIAEDSAAALAQLAASLQAGYRPEHVKEEVFLALLLAEAMVRREQDQCTDLVRFDRSMETIRMLLAQVSDLADGLAMLASKHGYDSRDSIVQCIDKCLLASFLHCGESFDLDRELTLVNPLEPDQDKFPTWLPILPPRVKCQVGRYMARNDISSDWSLSIEPTITARARVTFWNATREKRCDVALQHEVGPPTRYSGLPEEIAETLAMKHRNRTGSYQLHGGPPHPANPLPDYDPSPSTLKPRDRFDLHLPAGRPDRWHVSSAHIASGRHYMAGLGRFLTAARLAEQLAGEHPYGYALGNPVTYTDPTGLLSVLGGVPSCANHYNNPCTPGNLKQCTEWCASGGESVWDCHEHGSSPFTFDCTCTSYPPNRRPKWGRVHKYCSEVLGYCSMHNFLPGSTRTPNCTKCYDTCMTSGQWPTTPECSYWNWGMNSNKIPPIIF